MLGAIAGDVIGSVHEQAGTKTKKFPLFTPWSTFTDDTVLTVAVADSLLHGGDYVDAYHRYYDRYPRAGYGGTFMRWARARQREPYGSWCNGSAMRVSPVSHAFDTIEEVLREAARSAAATHNHAEGIRGAQATTAAVFLARTGQSKEQIRTFVEDTFGYQLAQPLSDIQQHYRFDVSCQGSVPQSIIAFLESADLEDAVRNAISLGGDADTMASIAGAIAEAYYGGVPPAIETRTLAVLDDGLRAVVAEFRIQYGVGAGHRASAQPA